MNTVPNGKTAEDCGGCEAEQVCGLEQLACDVCTYKDGTYATGALAIWDGCIVESLVDQMVDPTDGWVDVKSPDSEKQWKKLGTIEDLLKLMGAGCPLEVEKAVACMPVSAGEWRCYDGCYRQAKVDLVIVEAADGSLNIPAMGEAENAQWSKCWTVEDVLNLLNDPKGIKSIDDSNPSTTTVTLNDGTVFPSPEQPDTDTDTRLTNPTLNADGSAYVWDIVDENGNKVGEVVQSITPGSLDCGGNEVANRKFVACQNLGADFSVAPDTGEVSVNFKELCIETSEGNSLCDDYTQVYIVKDATTGCKKLITADTLDLRIGAYPSDNDASAAATVLLPTNPTDASTFYTKTALQADMVAGAIDQALLDTTRVSCNAVNFPCDSTYEFEIGAVLSTDWDLQGKSNFVIAIDGVIQTHANAGVNINSFGAFTSVEGGYQAFKELQVTAGSHDICIYMVGDQGVSGTAAQAAFTNTSNGQPRLVIRRVITSI